MQILIAEDDVTSRLILASALKKGGYEVLETVDGVEALEELTKPDGPKMAVLDWIMPKMDGMEVVRQIRELHLNEPTYIIMLTSKSEKVDVIAGLDAGADDYLAKPFDPLELQARIRVGQRMVDLQATIVRQATYDPLTNALNRRGILHNLETELSRARRSSSILSVAMCDIDYFKQVNDTHGHLVGDDVLKGLVSTMQSGLRDYDLIGRYGGEEFLVVAPGSTGTPEESLYHRLRNSIAKGPLTTRCGDVQVTVSIGVAASCADSTADSILAQADKALYRAKDEGRNRVVYSTVT